MEENINQPNPVNVPGQTPPATPPPVSKSTNIKYLKTIGIGMSIVSFCIGIAVIGYFLVTSKNTTTQTACTLEAKVCPNGTSVGRTGPNCSFAPCPTAKISPTPDPTASWKIYTNNELGLSFRYPSDWGDLQETDEKCLLSSGSARQADGQPCVHISIYSSAYGQKEYFLDTESTLFSKYAPGRGGMMGDIFSISMKNGMAPESLVKNYCNPSNRSLAPNDTCVVTTNPNGILYAKALDTYTTGGEKALFYYIYHPNHQFPGIALSTSSFMGTPIQSSLEKVFDQILSTFKFTN